jgi:hypothetical protein
VDVYYGPFRRHDNLQFCLLWARTVDEVGNNNNNELDDDVMLNRRLERTYSGYFLPFFGGE